VEKKHKRLNENPVSRTVVGSWNGRIVG